MASVSSKLDETPLQDKTPKTAPQNREEKLSKDKKTLEEGKILRKKIRHLRREDERQAKSLTQDLKDIRESLSDVNNLNKIQKFDGNDGKKRSYRNYKETGDFYSNNSTRTKRGQGKYCEAKATDKTQHCEVKTTDKSCNNFEENSCSTSSSVKQKTSSSSKQRKTVRFEDEVGANLGKKESDIK